MKVSKTQMKAKADLAEAAAIIANGGFERDIRNKFDDLQGMKLYGIIELNRRFPKMELIKRLTELDPSDSRFLKYSDIRAANIPNLLMRSDPSRLEEENRKRKNRDLEQYSPLTLEHLEAFCSPPKVNKRMNCVKMMSRSKIMELNEVPIEIIRDTVSAILSNNMDLIRKYMAKADVINAVVEALVK